jgi:hypothetical protein
MKPGLSGLGAARSHMDGSGADSNGDAVRQESAEGSMSWKVKHSTGQGKSVHLVAVGAACLSQDSHTGVKT